VYRLGQRAFCAAHYRQALRAVHRPWWRGALIEIAAVAGFVLAVYLAMGPEAIDATFANALWLVLPPAVLLLAWVWRQDWVEPEPPGMVLLVFGMGVLLYEGAVLPLTRDIFSLSEWQHLIPAADWVAAFLVIGALRQACVYAAVRYTVYMTDELDEPADGVVYAGAAGLGLATAQNFHFVLDSEQILPLEGAIYVATTCLVALSASAAVGVGLARRRLRPHPKEMWIALAYVVAVVLDGGLTQLCALAGIDGGDFEPGWSLAVACGGATLLLFAVDYLMSRLSLEAFVVRAEGTEP
jgi:RsiW-degrading membrane proteinase PrsW (M82 family)